MDDQYAGAGGTNPFNLLDADVPGHHVNQRANLYVDVLAMLTQAQSAGRSTRLPHNLSGEWLIAFTVTLLLLATIWPSSVGLADDRLHAPPLILSVSASSVRVGNSIQALSHVTGSTASSASSALTQSPVIADVLHASHDRGSSASQTFNITRCGSRQLNAHPRHQ